jgi:hypothetical protein
MTSLLRDALVVVWLALLTFGVLGLIGAALLRAMS